jgi:hypothetical protein
MMKRVPAPETDSMKSWNIAALILAAAPAVALVLLIAHYAVDAPYGDQWELVPLIRNLHTGAPSFNDFFAQHNEHRIFFPRLIMIAVASISNWDTRAECAVSVLLALGSFLVLRTLIRDTFTSRKLSAAASCLASLIVFSPNQSENWLWGWQIQWFLCVLGLTVAVRASWNRTEPITPRRLAIAGAAATVATYSLASGIFVWISGIPLLWRDRFRRRIQWAWAVTGLLVIGAYFIGYRSEGGPSRMLFLHEPLGSIEYFLIYAGAPITLTASATIPIAALYLCATAGGLAFAFRRLPTGSMKPLQPWLCLLLFGALTAWSIDAARLGFGVEQAFSIRYVTLSDWLLLPACIVFLKIVENQGLRTAPGKAAAVTVITLTVLIGLNWVRGGRQFAGWHDFLTRVQTCTRTARDVHDPCLVEVYPDPNVLWPRLEYLRSIHWGGQ